MPTITPSILAHRMAREAYEDLHRAEGEVERLVAVLLLTKPLTERSMAIDTANIAARLRALADLVDAAAA